MSLVESLHAKQPVHLRYPVVVGFALQAWLSDFDLLLQASVAARPLAVHTS